MKIYVAGSAGVGSTELSAFDDALIKTGVANYNLIRLSSVIPPQSEVSLTDHINEKPGSWGDRLYVVYAESRTSNPGEEVWSGIGWVQDPTDGKGLFVEHEGHSEAEVETLIRNSLKDLMNSRGLSGLEIKTKLVGATCNDNPVCALVVACYQVSDWSNKPFFYT